MKKTTLYLVSLAILLTGMLYAGSEIYALDAPHDATSTTTVSCANCHPPRGVTPGWMTAATPNDMTQMNNQCFQCHIPGVLGPNNFGQVQTHSQFQTSGTATNGWVMECRVCHNPHYQMQAIAYPTEGYLFTGVVAAATVSSVTVTGSVLSAGTLTNYLLIPDITYPNYLYRITGNTANTITIQTGVSGGIATAFVGPNATFGVKLGKLMKETIITPNSGTRNVKFFTEQNANSFATGTTPATDSICQVCHTQTQAFRNDGTLEGGTHTPAVAGTNCTVCHEHKSGFKGGGCTNCHGYPPGGVVTTDGGTGPGAIAGAHVKHVTSSGMVCADCHTGGMTSTIYDKAIEIGFSLGTGTYDGRRLPLANGFTYTKGNPGTAIVNTGAMNCAVYCHDPSSSGAKSPAWGSAFTGGGQCDDCHGGNKSANAPGFGVISSGKHTAHIANSDANLATFACGRCHAQTVTASNDRLITGTKHSNKAKDVDYDSLNTGAASNNCANLYCHSDGKGLYTNYTITANWRAGSTNLTCKGCHGTQAASLFGEPGSVSGGAGVASANSHTNTAHVSVAGDCGKCHTSTSTTGTSITGTVHLDNNMDVTIAAAYDVDGNSANNYTPGAGNKTCSATTCHGASSPQWGRNTTNAACTKCHGRLVAPGSYTLNDAAPGAGGTGISTGGSTLPADPKVGTHRSHLEATHGYNQAVQCNICHTVPAAFGSNGHVYNGVNDTTKGTAEVIFTGLSLTNPGAGPGTPTYASSQCSNVYCHDSRRFKNHYGGGSNPAPTWNVPYLAGAAADCSTCHGYPPAGGHSASNNCVACHQHVNATNDGFKPVNNPVTGGIELHADGFVQGGGCDSCHGNPPVIAAYSGTQGLVGVALGNGDTSATSPISPGAHNRHANGLQLGMSCDTCHMGSDMSYRTNGKTLDMGFKIDSITFPGFVGTASTATFYSYNALTNGFTYSASNPGTTLSPVANRNNSCALYCHGAGTTGKAPLTAATITNPTWVGGAAQAACGSCHGGASYATAATNPPTTGAHVKHAGSANIGMACNTCHGTTVDSSHVNGSVAWSLATADARFGVNAKYNGSPSGSTGALAPSASFGGCEAIYCHSNGTSLVGTNPSFTWSSTVNAECSSCHGGNSAAAAKIATNAHGPHVNDTANKVGKNIGCAECHNATASADRTISNTANHSNAALNIKFDNAVNLNTDAPTYNGGPATGANGAAKTPGTAGYNCSNVYCHSSGNVNSAGTASIPATFRTAAWNGGAMGCDGCHGDQAGKSWPVYASGAAGSQTANNHVKHVEGSSLSCDFCHNTTTISMVTSTATMTVIPAGSGGQHLDRTDDVSFKTNGGKTGTYAANTKTCSTTYCHGTTSPQWGGAALACSGCHDASNTGLSTRHAQHYASTTVPTALAGGTDAHTATGYVYACLNCHPTNQHTTGPDTISKQDANILLGTKISAYTAGVTTSADSKGYLFTNNGSCATVCHTSDGVASAPVTAATWSGAVTGGCAVCHRAAGDNYAAMTTQASRLTNTHATHMATDRYGANAIFGCAACHSGTSATNSSLTPTGRSQHPNQVKNVAFNATVGGTWNGASCQNTYCHSLGTAMTGTHALISWSTATNTNCASCHGSASTIATNAHGPHVNDTANKVGKSIACSECHNATATGSTAIASYLNHVDKNLNIKFDNAVNLNTDAPTYNGGPATGANGAAKTPGTAGYNCSNVYCHSSGNVNSAGTASIPATFRTAAWNGGAMGCDGCHGDQAGKSWPVYASGAAGSQTANNHVKHVEGSSLSCDFCHNTTTISMVTSTATMTVIPAGSGGQHLDRTDDVSFKTNGGKTGTYAANTKTCSTTYCHGTTSPQWGGAALACSGCHDASNTGLSTRHAQHYASTTVPTALAGGTDAHTATGYVYACLNCHPTNQHTTGPDTISKQDANILLGTKISAYTAGVTTSADSKGYLFTNNGSCATVCHTSDGVASAPVTAATWSGAVTGGCAVCHRAAGDNYAAMTTQASRLTNTHATHMATDRYGANAIFGCAACHSGTSATNSSLTPTGRSQHPNQVKNVAFNATVGGTWNGASCQNTYCHSLGTAMTGTHALISWSTATNTNCASCHGNSSTIATGAHAKHLATTGMTCNTCHAATASNNTTISSYTNHVNQNVTINLSGSAAGATAAYNGQTVGGASAYQKPVGTPQGTCNTTVCHGGNSGTWGVVNNDATCVKCHGVAGSTPAAYATDSRRAAPGYAATTAPTGTGVNTAGITGAITNNVSSDPKVGAHDAHLRGLGAYRGAGNGIACNDCHTVTALNSAGHMDGSSTMIWSSFTTSNNTLAPSYSGGQCSATYCHGAKFSVATQGTNTRPTWTDGTYLANPAATKSNVDCNKCHQAPAFGDSTYNHSGLTIADDCSGCHGHNGNGSGHLNGILEAGGSTCNSCHGYPPTPATDGYTSDGKAYRTTVQEGKGKHGQHVDHLIARARIILSNPTFALNPSTDTFGSGNSWTYVCGVCHNGATHTTAEAIGGTGRTISIPATYQLGTAAPRYNGAVGASSGTTPKTCSNISCHFQTTPYWQDPAKAGL